MVGAEIGSLDLSLSLTSMFVLAGVLAAIRLALSATSGWLTARIATDALGQMRKRTFASFVEASWSTQATEREGHLQELMTTHIYRIAMALVSLLMGVVGLLNFAALLVIAFLVNAAASLAGLASTCLLFVAVRPLVRASKAQSRKAAVANLAYVESVAESVVLSQETQVFGTAAAQRRHTDGLVDAVVVPFFRNQALARLLPPTIQGLAMALVLAGLVAVNAVGAEDVSSLGAAVLLLLRTTTCPSRIALARRS